MTTMDTLTGPLATGSGVARQRIEFRSGDEAAAIAARHIRFQHEDLGISHGAALAGERVVCTTNSHGLRSVLEQLRVQAGARVPMVLNVGCDHACIDLALNSGWIVFCARDPQAVYDLNLAAVKLGEHPQVRLPVLVAYDGFVTSHEKRRIHVLEEAAAVARFLGVRPAFPTPLDTEHPATFGANVDDRTHVRQAIEAARGVIADIFADLAKLTGRAYPVLEAYEMEDAEAAVVLLNSAAETAKEAVDRLRSAGRKVGALSPNVLRPFPGEEFRARLRGVKAATIAERADSFGNLSMEVRAAIQLDPANQTRVMSRIYTVPDAEQLLGEAVAAPGQPAAAARPGLARIRAGEVSRGMAKVRRDESSGRLEVELEPLWKMTSVPSRLAPGHGACPGCGVFPTLHQIYKVLEGDLVVLFQSGCATVVSAAYPSTAHRINTLHDLSGNGAATLSGLVEAYRERVRRGELPASKDITFVMISGDGGMDAGLGNAIAAANRNHRMMILEYDNHGRMSTGAQPSYSTPLGHWGKSFHHRDTAQIFAACHLPYVFTASEGYPEDLMRKVAKAQWYAKSEGMVYGKVLSFCPLHWRTADDAAQPVLQAAIDSCFFPLYEVEHGHTAITYDPDAANRRRPVADWLKLMGKTAHLADAANAAIVADIQVETDRRWARLKAMHEHPLL